MENERLVNNFKFWVDKEIIHCKIFNNFDGTKEIDDLENIFLNQIFKLSGDVHMPILFDMEDLSFTNAIKVFKFLSNNTLIKSLVLSKTFLVHSLPSQISLNIQSFLCNPGAPDLIFKNSKSAVKFCINDTRTYNSLN